MLARTWFMRWARFVAAAMLVLAGLLAPPSVRPAFAQTITVTTTAEAPGASGDCTLGEAIQAANTGAQVDACSAGDGNDVIVLSGGAIYTLTTSFANANSAYAVKRSLTIDGHGAKLAHNPLGSPLRFFTMTASSSLTLIGLTLTGGRALGQDGQNGPSAGVSGTAGQGGYGGAIYSLSGDIILDGVTFLNNTAQGGQGGSGFGGSSSSYGAAGGLGGGGAIYSVGSITVRGAGAHFTHNQALGGKGGNGGTFLTNSGPGGTALGGAVWIAQLDASDAALSATDNLAQGGKGGFGAANGSGGSGVAGGLLVNHALLLADVSLTQNRAQGGDAGDSISSNPSMLGGTASGGGAVAESVALAGGTVMSNTAQGGAGPTGGFANGGGLSLGNPSPADVLQQALILGNTAAGGSGSDLSSKGGDASGGGITVNGGTLRLAQSALVSNFAIAGSDPGASFTAASMGGGLVGGGSQVTLTLTNTTLALNGADTGGAIQSMGTTTSLTHVTIVSNTANNHGGALAVAGLGHIAFLINSLLAYNAGDNCQGLVAQGGANLQFPGTSCLGVTTADPLLSPVADNGGHTLTAALSPGSPALDAASPTYCPPIDQRGYGRPAGSGCDLGAYERWLAVFLPLVRR